MRTVWKYELPVTDRPRIVMKKDAEILHIDHQKYSLYLQIWALVDTDKEDIERFFTVAGTGHPLNHLRDNQKFLGTVIDPDLNLVWHVWTD